MKKVLVAASVLALGIASAQAQRESHPGETQSADGKNVTQIQGKTKIDANAKNVTTFAAGSNSKAATNVGAVGGQGVTQIQGNTTIDATARDVSTIAIGRGSTATTNVGTIGK